MTCGIFRLFLDEKLRIGDVAGGNHIGGAVV